VDVGANTPPGISAPDASVVAVPSTITEPEAREISHGEATWFSGNAIDAGVRISHEAGQDTGIVSSSCLLASISLRITWDYGATLLCLLKRLV